MKDLEWFWSGLGVVFVCWEWFWSASGVVLEWFGSGFGMLGMVLEWFWSGSGVVLDWFRFGFGLVSEWFRNGFEWLWNGSAIVREWFRNGLCIFGGGRLQWEDRRSRSGYCRYVLTCAHHPQYVKKRNAMAGQCRNYGVYEPQAYLAVWQEIGSNLSGEQHRHKSLRIPLDRQRAWLASQGLLAAL